MNYKILGKSGLRVSEISLGTMTTGNSWGWGADKEPSLEVLKAYSDAGGNFIDTACNYQDGESEKIIGEFMADDRDRYVVATKYTLREGNVKGDPNYGGNHRKNLLRSVSESLKRLKTDHIDLLYLHMWDFTTNIEQVMRTLNDLVASSKVHSIGISDTPAWIVTRANTIAQMRGWYEFNAYQFPYSLGSRDPEREIVPMCIDQNITMAAWAVLGAGLFTGKYSRTSNNSGRLSENHWGSPNQDQLEKAKIVDEIADELGSSSSQVAIKWVLNQPGNFVPIIGSTNSDQIVENLAAPEINLSDDQMDRLNAVAGFRRGFAYDFLHSSNVKNLIHGSTYEKLIIN